MVQRLQAKACWHLRMVMTPVGVAFLKLRVHDIVVGSCLTEYVSVCGGVVIRVTMMMVTRGAGTRHVLHH